MDRFGDHGAKPDHLRGAHQLNGISRPADTPLRLVDPLPGKQIAGIRQMLDHRDKCVIDIGAGFDRVFNEIGMHTGIFARGRGKILGHIERPQARHDHNIVLAGNAHYVVKIREKIGIESGHRAVVVELRRGTSVAVYPEPYAIDAKTFTRLKKSDEKLLIVKWAPLVVSSNIGSKLVPWHIDAVDVIAFSVIGYGVRRLRTGTVLKNSHHSYGRS